MNRGTYSPGETSSLVAGAALTLLAFAGSLKENSLLSWIPLDLTLLATIVVTLILVVRLAQSFRNTIPNSSWVLVGLWLTFSIPVLWSSNVDHAREKILILFTVTLLCSAAAMGLMRSQAAWRGLSGGLLLLGIFATLGSVIGGGNMANDYSNRVTLQGSTTITTAQMACAGALVAFMIAWARIHTFWRFVAAFAVPLMFYAALASGSRGPVIAAIFAVVVGLLVSKQFRRHRLKGLVLATAGLATGVYFAVVNGADGLQRVMTFIAGDGDASTWAREHYFTIARQSFVDNPMGIGWSGFQKFGIEYPHNILLEIAAEAGIISLLAVFGVVIVAGVSAWKASDTWYGTLCLMLLTFTFTNAMVSSDINGNRLFWIVVFASLALGSIREKAQTADDSKGGLERDLTGTGGAKKRRDLQIQ